MKLLPAVCWRGHRALAHPILPCLCRCMTLTPSRQSPRPRPSPMEALAPGRAAPPPQSPWRWTAGERKGRGPAVVQQSLRRQGQQQWRG